ncbi:unnamed protein product [Acanthoscelides obtectus]|uniref:Peptidase S1 domain-containing protein n=1 Tax=Acanthoscelides obtectus TaxID=200917 RepID=A0A9P0KYL5_ACAOB|nr:unnamed protein product [Acanthoscelides obtectus]CAK1643487.1 Kallikrein-12 [Acanthoscelides obtectus]
MGNGSVAGDKKGAKDELVLSCAQLKFLAHNECKEVYKKYNDLFMGDTFMCTNTTGQDACYGDSGAPLMCGGVQYGLVTWGIGCSDNLPGIFTRVDKYREFMTMVLDGVIDPRTPSGAVAGRAIVLLLYIGVLALFIASIRRN